MDAVRLHGDVSDVSVSGGRGLKAETKTMNKIKKLFVGALTLAPLAVFADAGAPLDLTSTGTTIAGYIATAAGAGVAVLAGLYGVRVIIRAFKSVK